MQLAQKIAWDDTVLPFQLDHSDIRGRMARLNGTLAGVLKQHDYPPPVEALVVEMTLLTALIGQTIKLRWKLSLQVRGNGPVRLIATDYLAPREEGGPARIRAYANFDGARIGLDDAPIDLTGKGCFAILIDQGPGMTPYQGITPLAGGSLASCAETYFAQSEQLPTRFLLAFGKSALPGESGAWRGGGVMLQHMPEVPPRADEGGTGEDGLLRAEDLVAGEDRGNWTRANAHLDGAEESELIGPTTQSTEVIYGLFHEDGPRVFEPQRVEFGCTCSAERVRVNLSIYSAKDISRMTTEEGTVTADCQFCGAHYEFDPKTLGFEAEEAPGGE